MDLFTLFTNFCISTALAVLILFIILTLRNRRSATSRFSLMVAGICVSSFFLFLPPYANDALTWLVKIELEGKWHYAALHTAVYALFDSIKAAAGGQAIGTLEDFTIDNGFFRFLYICMNYGYYAAAPLMTSGLILSLIGDLWDQIRWHVQWRNNYHVFSQLNDISLALARTIREKRPHAVLVFCDSKDADKKLKAESRSLYGLNLYASCKNLRLPLGQKRMEYYMVSACEDDNLRTAELLITKYRDKRRRIIINALAASETAIHAVESMEKGGIGLRFFDGTALLCSKLLWKHPPFLHPHNQRSISVAIVGCGRTGIQMLKTLSWYTQIIGVNASIRAYDRDPAVPERFFAQCPELSDSCDIVFHTVDIHSRAFDACFLDPCEGSPDATYCLVCTGDDDENMTVADRIYRLCRVHNRFEWTPTILTRVRNHIKSDVYSDSENSYLQTRNIHTFGGVEEALSSDMLFHSYLERLSFAVNLCYWGLLPGQDPSAMTRQELKAYLAQEKVLECRDDFLHSEYHRRSSMAAALHIPAKLQSCGILPENGLFSDETARAFLMALEQDPQLAERLARNEHGRWNAFMRSEGFRTASWDMQEAYFPYVANNQDQLSKYHLCITDWDALDELNKMYLALNPPSPKNFKESDFKLIRGIPRIIMLTNRLMETGLDSDM